MHFNITLPCALLYTLSLLLLNLCVFHLCVFLLATRPDWRHSVSIIIIITNNNNKKRRHNSLWTLRHIDLFVFAQKPPPSLVGQGLLFHRVSGCHTKRRTTVGSTPLDEWSSRRTDLYLTTHKPHNTHTSMPPVGFEPTIPAGEWPQNYALDRATTGTGDKSIWLRE